MLRFAQHDIDEVARIATQSQGEKELFSVSMKGLPYTISVKLGRRKTRLERERIVKISILSLDGRGQR